MQLKNKYFVKSFMKTMWFSKIALRMLLKKSSKVLRNLFYWTLFRKNITKRIFIWIQNKMLVVCKLLNFIWKIGFCHVITKIKWLMVQKLKLICGAFLDTLYISPVNILVITLLYIIIFNNIFGLDFYLNELTCLQHLWAQKKTLLIR